MLFVVFVILCVTVVFLIIWMLINKKIHNYANNVKKHVQPCATGCASSLSCKNMNFRIAAEAGYDPKRFTFCDLYGDIVRRMDHCLGFSSKGCANGICGFASNSSSEACFCQYQQQTVPVRASCPYYQDFFDTRMVRGLQVAPTIDQSLVREMMQTSAFISK